MDHKVGVIPFDVKDARVAIMFVTSQGRGRWILPKGNLKTDETAKKACKREAFEEAGVEGTLLSTIPMTLPISKSENGSTKTVAVTYYPLLVKKQFDEWPESSKRQRHWSTLEDAKKVTDSEDFLKVIQLFTDLKPLILDFSMQKREKQQAKLKQVQ